MKSFEISPCCPLLCKAKKVMLNVMYFTEERPHRKQTNNKLFIHICIFIYIWKHTTWSSFSVLDFLMGGKNKAFCREPSNEHSYQIWFDQWFQGGLKCKTLRMTPRGGPSARPRPP
jgi:hypothetical protein